MKTIVVNVSLAAAATLITACQSTEIASGRWSDMQIDIALRHRYEQYACGCHSLAGYSKEASSRSNDRVVAPSKRASKPATQMLVHADSQDALAARQAAQQTSDRVNELSQKIDVLEEALKSNVAATNQNQNLLVEQINALRAQLAALQSKPEVVSPPLASGIRIPGN
jgi:hypothetical protein